MDVVEGIDNSVGSGDRSGVSGVMAGVVGRWVVSVVFSHGGMLSRRDCGCQPLDQRSGRDILEPLQLYTVIYPGKHVIDS